MSEYARALRSINPPQKATSFHFISYKVQSLPEKSKPGQKRNAGPRQGYGQMDVTPSRDEGALWNFTRRAPIKAPTGDLEMEFRTRAGNIIDAGVGRKGGYGEGKRS